MDTRFTTFLAISFAVFAVGAAFGQVGDPPPMPHVEFGAHAVTRIPSYARAANDTALFFGDDPIGVEVTITNHTGKALRLSAPGRWWIDDLRLSMVALQKTGDSQPVAVSIAPVFDGRDPTLDLPQEGLTSVELRIRPEHQPGPLEPGFYRLTVTLGEGLAGYGRHAQAPVTRELNLEIRRAATLEESLDDYLQQAFFASRAERYDEAGVWASLAVAAHPSSAVALAEIANFRRFQGRCMEGAPMLRQAMRIVSTGGDPLLVYPLPDSYGDALQAMATHCERESEGR